VRTKQLIHRFEPASLNGVYENLLDLRKYGYYHPVMTSVEIVNERNGVITYEVREKTKIFGFIPLRPVYRATVTEVEKGKIIRYDSDVKKNIRLEIVFTFNQKDIVQEDIIIKAGWPIGGIFMNLLYKMHLRVMENMRLPGYQKPVI